MDGGKPMSEYYEGSSEDASEDVNQLEEALNRAVDKYFKKHPQDPGADPVLFRIVELQVYASHNPIHGYRVVVTPGP
jgi:hypothetical protein